MSDDRAVLEGSVNRLRDLVQRLGPDDLRAQAYPSEWTVADVLSHLGSGAVISGLRIDAALAGGEVDPVPIWDEWNAKDPDAKAADALVADQALLERLDAVPNEDRATIELALGPMRFDYEGFVRLRVNEHVVHSWDVAVTFDPSATLAPDAVAIVLEVLPMIARFSARPTSDPRSLRVSTTAPDRQFLVDHGTEGMTIAPAANTGPPDLALPAEAFIRLVYGRLDADHTPPFHGAAADLDNLRDSLPGI